MRIVALVYLLLLLLSVTMLIHGMIRYDSISSKEKAITSVTVICTLVVGMFLAFLNL